MTVELVHGPECECFRCRGYGLRNEAALRHGAYSTVAIGPRGDELTDELREVVPVYSPADEPTLRLYGLTLARIECAAAALDALEPGGVDKARLREDLRGWVNTALRLANDLGMTPTSRARLGLDVALAHRASEQALDRLAAEGRAIRERRAAE